MRRLTGIGASEGVSIGKVLLFREEEMVIPEVKAADSTIESELTKLEEGLKKSKTQLISIREKVKEKMGEDKAAIFDGHIMLLEDEDLLMEVQDKIKGEKMPAARALKEGIDEYCEMISQLDDAYLRERAADLQDIGKRWLKNLLGIKIYDLSNLEPDTVVVTYDLTPSDTAQLDLKNCVGFITEVGGKTAHSAIMARSLELPAVVGVKGILSEVKEGETVIMDGEAGELFLAPEAELQSQYETKREILKKEKEELKKLIGEEAITTDGRKVDIWGNIGSPNDVDAVIESGATGIGLYRTEFLFMNSDHFPTEEEQLFGARRQIPQYAFVGQVLEYDPETQIATIQQRNNFKVGDHIEFYGPGMRHHEEVLTTLWDENGEEIEAAPHAMMICKMKVTEPVKPLDMIRKRR